MPGTRSALRTVLIQLVSGVVVLGGLAALPADASAAAGPSSQPAQSTISASDLSSRWRTPRFRAKISRVTAADLTASWRPGCPVGPAGLRAVDVTHWDMTGRVKTGRLIVAADQARPMVRIMRQLYAVRYPIERMEPVEAYGGSDDASMEANNTSAFNCRATTGGTSWSEHSYGRAIDVNPLLNPYVRGSLVLPAAGAAYVDRSQHVPGMIHAGDPVVRAFAKRGWKWGGAWTSPIDYQHFSTTGR